MCFCLSKKIFEVNTTNILDRRTKFAYETLYAGFGILFIYDYSKKIFMFDVLKL